MPLRHCDKCHHEWETENEKCDWCGNNSHVLEEVTPFERFVEELLKDTFKRLLKEKKDAF